MGNKLHIGHVFFYVIFIKAVFSLTVQLQVTLLDIGRPSKEAATYLAVF